LKRREHIDISPYYSIVNFLVF